jgi:hypothetical protein
MKLIYRGTAYDYDPTYAPRNAGRPARPARGSQVPYALIYRGTRYEVDPQSPFQAVDLPETSDLIYRGVSYRVQRNAQGEVINMTTLGAATGGKVQIPSSLPQQYVSKVHQANLLNNLQHRLEVAQQSGDRHLVKLLEEERNALMA